MSSEVGNRSHASLEALLSNSSVSAPLSVTIKEKLMGWTRSTMSRNFSSPLSCLPSFMVQPIHLSVDILSDDATDDLGLPRVEIINGQEKAEGTLVSSLDYAMSVSVFCND